MAVFCLLDNKGYIYIPNPKPGQIGSRADNLALNSSMKKLSTIGLIGKPMAAPCSCSKYLSWKRK